MCIRDSHNAAESVSLPLNMIPGNFPGDPFGSACVCGDFSVHRHGVFHGNEGAFCGDIVEEHLVQRIAFLLQNIFGHIYACLLYTSIEGAGVPLPDAAFRLLPRFR